MRRAADDTRVEASPPSSRATPATPAEALRRLQSEHRACTRCVVAGHIAVAHPVFSGRFGQRILLVGQAPGPVEVDAGRPFAGRAGRVLMRWMVRAGFQDEAEVRARVYITSTTTCFPGRRADGAGDRCPGPAEVGLCAPWLDGVLELLAPRLVLCVGGLALERLTGGPRRLDDVVGRVLDPRGQPIDGAGPPAAGVTRVLVPLPHPSGQSRWLNDPRRAGLLDTALGLVAGLLPWAEAG